LACSNIEKAALKVCEEISYNEKSKSAFIEGAKWATNELCQHMQQAYHPMASDKENAQFKRWALRDVKNFVYSMLEYSK